MTNSQWKKISFPYEINFHKKEKNIIKKLESFDISKNMKIKRIQLKSLSCEISATADILSFLTWKEVMENDLLKELAKSQYNKLPTINTINWKKYWWNPQEWFVWYIDKLPNWNKARQRKMTGYWVLEKPIEKIINKHWFKTKTISKYNYKPWFTKKEHLTLILEELEKWNMVQLWWDICTNPKYYNWKENWCSYNWKPSWNSDRKISWYYKNELWEDKKYVGLNWEHAYYLLGYKWKIDNPTDIIVWDTYTGRHIYKTEEWIRKWQKMQYRSIIIYKK
jgi:hypothetical protein